MCLQEFVSVWRFVHLCVILSSSAQEPDLTDAVQMIVCAVEILLSLTRIFTSIWNSGNYLQWHKPAPSALNRSVNDSLYFRASFHMFMLNNILNGQQLKKAPVSVFFIRWSLHSFIALDKRCLITAVLFLQRETSETKSRLQWNIGAVEEKPLVLDHWL